MGKVALVTGGMGFIGSHLAQGLAKLGHEVKVLDISMSREWWNQTIDGITYYKADVAQLTDDSRVECDWCFHLAALADIIPSIKDPVAYHRVNVDGTINVLHQCTKLGAKKFIYASSTSIYGIPEQYPTPEAAPASPQYPYALTKWIAEEAVMHWGKVYHLPVVALRITTAYGPGMRARGAYGSVMKVFLPQKANNMPYTVTGHLGMSRDFINVEDVCDAFIRAAESEVSGEAFNVGSGQPTTLGRLIELLGDDNGIVYLPRRPGEPEMTWADISKIKNMLGWEPKVSIEDGVRVMLEHLDDWKGEKVWTPEEIKEATKEWYRYLS